jgi:BirA family biotin operon repressor/biotin-[acetyl-CoA-carboxylase] ligase
MASQWSDLGRPPLSVARIARAVTQGPVWREVRIFDAIDSTNADVATAAGLGDPEGLVVIAEHQHAGRGRLDRQWSSPPRAGVLLSVLLRPTAEVATWSLLPLLTGLAIAEALDAVAKVEAGLKWPNDLVLGDRKVGGILAERHESAVVIGIGVNVSTRPNELPVETATSIAIAGGETDREPIVKEMLRSLERRYVAWRDTNGSADSVIPAYRQRCETFGRHVAVELPGGDVVRGAATGVDDRGCLVVARDDTGAEQVFMVGDVTHVRRD